MKSSVRWKKRDGNSDEQNCRMSKRYETDNDLTFRDQASLSAGSRSDGAAPLLTFNVSCDRKPRPDAF